MPAANSQATPNFMAQFFSSSPVDYGSDYYVRASENAANSIAGAISKVAANKQDEKMLRIKDSLQAKRQQEEADRAFVESLAESGVAPIYNADGSLNRVASGAAKVKADEARRVSTDRAIQSSRDSMELDKGLASYGINPKAAMKPNGWSLSPGSVNTPEDPRNQYAALRGAEADFESRQRARGLQDQQEKERQGMLARERLDQLGQYRSIFGRDPEATDFGADGLLSGDATKRLAVASQEFNKNNKRTAAEINAGNTADSTIKAGLAKEEERDEVYNAAVGNQGRVPNLPQSERDNYGFNLTVLNALTPLVERIGDTGAKDMYGPIEGRIRSMVGSVTGGEGEFRGVEQAYKEAMAGRAFAQGGKALTTYELEAIKSQIGNPNDQDFPQRVVQYYERAARDAKLARDNLYRSPFRFNPEGAAAINRLDDQIERAQGVISKYGGAFRGQGSASEAPVSNSKFKVVEIR